MSFEDEFQRLIQWMVNILKFKVLFESLFKMKIFLDILNRQLGVST